MDDAALVESARLGDRDAFAAIYDRYADSIHDFCHSVLRDRHEAADVTQDTFLTAAQQLGQLRDPSKLRAWLFAIARHRALRHGARRARTVLAGDDADTASTEPAPDEPLRQQEMQRLVWDAADGLSERDRAILDLNLRQGLEGQELADALGVEVGHVYVLVNRLKEQVERSIGALLVARFGRADCDTLSQLLDGWDGKLSPLLRKRIARHVDGCDICSDGRQRLASPLALLAAAPLLAVPAGARDQVLGDIDLDLISSTRPLPGWDKQGFPPGLEARRNRRGGVVAILAGVAAIVVAALLLAPSVDDGISTTTIEASAPTTVPTSSAPAAAMVSSPDNSTVPIGGAAGSVTPTPAVTSPGGPAGGVGVITPGGARGNAIDGGAGGVDGGIDGGRSSPGPGSTPQPADTRPPDIAASAEPGCTVLLVATVSDDSPIGSVTVAWTGPDQVGRNGTMASVGGGRYEFKVDPYARAGTVTWSVTAIDASGNGATVAGPPVEARCTAGAP